MHIHRLTIPLALVSTFVLAGRVTAQDVDLKPELDRCVRWLRQSQDVASGSYGGTVEGTAWSLRALHDCPRRYRMIDGPFVSKAVDWLVTAQRADGAIAGEKSSGAGVAEETALAVMALKLYAEETGPTGEALGNFPQAFSHLGLINTARNLTQRDKPATVRQQA